MFLKNGILLFDFFSCRILLITYTILIKNLLKLVADEFFVNEK
jgi:hypothetical protein